MTGFDYQTVSEEIYQLTALTLAEYMEKVGDDYRGGGIVYESYPFDQINKLPSDSSAYGNRGKHFNCTVSLRWSGEKHDAWIKDFIQNFVRQAREVDRSVMLGEGKEPTEENGYVNFHLPGDPVEKAFGNNLPRLKEVKRKWDPNGRFNKWFSIPV